jgi:hypothetical protein
MNSSPFFLPFISGSISISRVEDVGVNCSKCYSDLDFVS